MTSADYRRPRGRWRALAMPAVVVMIVSSMPVRAAEPLTAEMAMQPLVERKVENKKRTKKHKRKHEDSIEEMIEDVFGPRAEEALRIANCESKFRPDAVSGAGAVGVFQIREPLHGWRVKKVKGRSLRDAATNIRVAHSLMKDQGWTPWVCARMLGITRTRARTTRYAPASSNSGDRSARVPRRPRMAP